MVALILRRHRQRRQIKMAALILRRHRQKRQIRRNRIFRDRTNPLDVYDDVELFTKFRFRRADILEITHELKKHIQHPNRTGALACLLFYKWHLPQDICGELIGVRPAFQFQCNNCFDLDLQNSSSSMYNESRNNWRHRKTKLYTLKWQSHPTPSTQSYTGLCKNKNVVKLWVKSKLPTFSAHPPVTFLGCSNTLPR